MGASDGNPGADAPHGMRLKPSLLADRTFSETLRRRFTDNAYIAACLTGDGGTTGDEGLEYSLSPREQRLMKLEGKEGEAVVLAGIVDKGPGAGRRHIARLLQDLTTSFTATPSFAATVERRLVVLRGLHSSGALGGGESAVASPAIRYAALPRGPPSPGDSVLPSIHEMALSAREDSLLSGTSVTGILGRLITTLEELDAAGLYAAWTPRPAAADGSASLNATSATATSTYSSTYLPRMAVTSTSVSEYWCGAMGTPNCTWECDLNAPAKLTRVTVHWPYTYRPETVKVFVRYATGGDFRNVGRSMAAGPSTAVKVKCTGLVARIRLVMEGFSSENGARCHAISGIRLQAEAPPASEQPAPPADRLAEATLFLNELANSASSRSEALMALLHVARTSGSLHSVLKLLVALVSGNDDALTEAMPTARLTALHFDLCHDIREGHAMIQESDYFFQAGDRYTITGDGRTVESQDGSSAAMVNLGFNRGIVEWQFRMDRDVENDEYALFGAGLSPLTSANYEGNPNVWVVRSYTGNTYCGNSSHKAKDFVCKIHPGNIVKITADVDAGTMSYEVNGTDYGVCFRGLHGITLHPLVMFYKGDRQVSLLDIKAKKSQIAEGLGVPNPVGAAVRPRPARRLISRSSDASFSGAGGLFGDSSDDDSRAPPDEGWTCAACTLANPPGGDKCAVCETARPPRAAGGSASAAWNCAACTMENSAANTKCAMCETPRPSEPPAPLPSPVAADSKEDEAAAEAAAAEGFPSTQGGVAARVLRTLAEAAATRNTEEIASESSSRDYKIDIASPFSVEASNHVVQAVCDILDRSVPAAVSATPSPKRDVGTEMALAAVEVMRLSLLRLEQCRVDPVEVGLLVDGGKGRPRRVSDAMDGLLRRIRELLRMSDAGSPSVPMLKEAVGGVLDVGLELFFPDPTSRVQIVLGLVREHTESPSGPDPAKAPLLSRLMQRLALGEGFSALVSERGGAAEHATSEMTRLLFDFAAKQTVAAIRAGGAGGAGGAPGERPPSSEARAAHDLLDGAGSLLGSYQLHVLSAAARTTEVDAPASQTLLAYTRTLFSKCASVLQSALDAMAPTGSDGGVDAAIVDKAIQHSVVGTLLPTFATSLCLFEKRLWLASALSPLVVNLTRMLDSVTSRIPAVVTEEREIHDRAAVLRVQEAESSTEDSIMLRMSVLSSGQLHLLLDVEKTLAVLGARLAATMIAGAPELEEEELLATWLKSPVLSAGLDSNIAGRAESVEPDVHAGLDSRTIVRLGKERLSVGELAERILRRPDSFEPLVWEAAVDSSLAGAALGGSADLVVEDIDGGPPPPVPTLKRQGTWSSMMDEWRTKGADDTASECNAFVLSLVSPLTPSAKAVPEPTAQGKAVYDWMLANVKENAFERRKKKFPSCEIAVLAVALKHSGLWREAKAALDAISGGTESTSVSPSSEMVALWKRSIVIRSSIDKQLKQLAKGEIPDDGVDADSEEETDGTSPGASESKSGGGGGGGAAAAAGAAGGAGGPGDLPLPPGRPGAIERAKSVFVRSRARRRRKLHVPSPRDDQAIQLAVLDRARFLLLTSPCVRDEPSKDAEGSGSQLNAKWKSLLPPPVVAPLLQRWSSTDVRAAPAGLLGASTRSDASAGAIDIGFDDDSSEDDTVAEQNARDTANAVLRYVTYGSKAPPSLVAALLHRRSVRASQRIFGLLSLKALLGALTPQSAQADALMYLRPAMRGRSEFVEGGSSGGVAGAMPDIATIRHHYMKALEGCPAALADRVQAAFISLYTYLSDLLGHAYEDSDPAFGHVLAWCWGLDFEARDHEFLLRIGIIPTLHVMMSLRRESQLRSLSEAASSARTDSSGEPAKWTPWSVEHVRGALASGSLTKLELLRHMRVAPAAAVPPDWYAANGLVGDARAATASRTVDQMASAYESWHAAFVASGLDSSSVPLPAESPIRRHSASDPGGRGPGASGEMRTGVTPERMAFQDFGRCLFRLIAAQAVGITKQAGESASDDLEELSTAESDTARYSRSLQDLIFGLARDEISLAARFMQELSAGAIEDVDTKVLQTVENAAHSHLMFLLSLSNTEHGVNRLLQDQVVRAILSLAHNGSPRVQRVCIRLLRVILPRLSSAVVATIIGAASGGAGGDGDGESGPAAGDAISLSFVPMGHLIVYLLTRLSESMCTAPRDDGASFIRGSALKQSRMARPVGSGAGFVTLSTSAEVCNLLRSLLRSEDWRGVVTSTAVAGIMAVRRFLPGGAPDSGSGSAHEAVTPKGTGDALETEEARKKYAFACACFCVLGANAEVMRVGARVTLGMDMPGRGASPKTIVRALLDVDGEGTVVSYGVGNRYARVLFFDPNDNADALPAAQEVPVDSLFPVQEVVAPNNCVALTPELLNVFSSLLSLDVPIARTSAGGGTPGPGDGKKFEGGTPGPTPGPEGPTKYPDDASSMWGDGATSSLAVWLGQLKARGLQSLQNLIGNAESARLAIDSGLLPFLFRTCQIPVPLSQFVGLPHLLNRSRILRQRLIELAGGVRYGNAGSDSAADSKTAERAMLAAQVQSILADEPLPLVIKALEMHGDDPERAIQWLLSEEKDVFVRAGGLSKKVGEATPRWDAAHELAAVIGLKPRLCWQALEMYRDDKNRAFEWLEAHGARYMPAFLDDEDVGTTRASSSARAEGDDRALVDEISREDADAAPRPGELGDGISGLVRQSSVLGGAPAGGGAGADESKAGEAAADAGAGDARQRQSSGIRGAAEGLLQPASMAGREMPGGTALFVTRQTGTVDSLRTSCRYVGTMVHGSTHGTDVQMRLLNEDTGLLGDSRVSINDLRVATAMYGKGLEEPDVFNYLTATAESAIATMAARRALLTLLLIWPREIPLTVHTIGGAADVVNLAKFVAASENIFANTREARASGNVEVLPSPLMDVVRDTVKDLLVKEARGDANPSAVAAPRSPIVGAAGDAPNWKCSSCTFDNAPTDARCQMCARVRPARSAFEARYDPTAMSLVRVLFEDCVWNIAESTKPGDNSEAKSFDSLHPYFPSCKYGGEVKFEGAKALWVSFDDRCATNPANSQLRFFADKSMTVALASYSGNSSAFKPLVVHSDRVYFMFQSTGDETTDLWGFKFFVAPMRGLQWLHERQVLSDASLEWACWNLEFLLHEVLHLLPPGAVHNAQTYQALVRYLRTPGSPYKHRVMALIAQLVRDPAMFPEDARPDFRELLEIERMTIAKVGELRGSGKVFLPPKLQQMIELTTLCRIAQRRFAQPGHERRPFDPARDVKTTAGGFLGLGRASDSLCTPVEIRMPPPLASMTEADILMDVFDISDCLVTNARLPDTLICLATAMCYNLPETDASRLKQRQVTDAVIWMGTAFNPDSDAQLVDWASYNASRTGKEMVMLTSSDLTFTARDEATFPALVGRRAEQLHLRFAVLKMFNQRLTRVIDMLDVANTEQEWSIGYRLRQLGHLIFAETKSRLVEQAVDRSFEDGSSGISMTLDNELAFTSMDSGKVTPSDSQCIFVQAFHAMGRQPGRRLRCRLDEKERLFHVKFRGEDGVDWGGLFRDAITRMVDDCFSQRFNLCLPCPNAARLEGETNKDKFIPNPRHTSPMALDMFEFLGKLIGVSMRHKLYLVFEFPPLIWKQLVGQTVTERDFEDIDDSTAQSIRVIRDCEAEGIDTPEKFAAAYSDMRLIVPGADGNNVELVPGGASLPLTWESREEWCRLALRYRLHEFDRQVAAMRRGLHSVVPERAVKMCTWGAFERHVCGDPHIDVDVLMAHTTYHGYSKGDAACRKFFEVMREMTNDERSGFVKFAWGRSRLPRGSAWDKPFKLTKKNGGDQQLPLAHACFFQVELPAYSTKEIMKKRLLTAINFSGGSFLMA